MRHENLLDRANYTANDLRTLATRASQNGEGAAAGRVRSAAECLDRLAERLRSCEAAAERYLRATEADAAFREVLLAETEVGLSGHPESGDVAFALLTPEVSIGFDDTIALPGGVDAEWRRPVTGESARLRYSLVRIDRDLAVYAVEPIRGFPLPRRTAAGERNALAASA